jgi:hypothetical protein
VVVSVGSRLPAVAVMLSGSPGKMGEEGLMAQESVTGGANAFFGTF